MGRDPDKQAKRLAQDPMRHSHANSVIFGLIAIALILAIGFFYLTNDRRGNRQADAVTGAAKSVDDAARVMEEAARNAADRLR